jgi:3-deoxy-D-manno-octulosonic acid (KDO) 8-phosphate synthase
MLLKKCRTIADDESKEMWQRRAAKNMCVILTNDIAAIGYNNMIENLEELRIAREQERYLSLEIDKELSRETL